MGDKSSLEIFEGSSGTEAVSVEAVVYSVFK